MSVVTGRERKCLTPETIAAECGRLSPDGKRMLFSRIVFGADGKSYPGVRELTVMDLGTGKMTKVDGVPARGRIKANMCNVACCWSPDGKRIAYVWQELGRAGRRAELEVRVAADRVRPGRGEREDDRHRDRHPRDRHDRVRRLAVTIL